MPAVTICNNFGAQENKVCHSFQFSLFVMKWGDWIPWSLFIECWISRQLFHSPLSPSSRGSLVPFHFLPLNWYICISEVVDISPHNLDSSLWFIQLSISHDALCMLTAAKALQSCPTLCNSIDGSPPGSALPGILQARTLKGCHFLLQCMKSEKWKWSRSVVSDSMRPHRQQPTKLLCPWDFPGKSTGVGCHCLLHRS